MVKNGNPNAKTFGILAVALGILSIIGPFILHSNAAFLVIPVGLLISILAYKFGAKLYGAVGFVLNSSWILFYVFWYFMASNLPPGI